MKILGRLLHSLSLATAVLRREREFILGGAGKSSVLSSSWKATFCLLNSLLLSTCVDLNKVNLNLGGNTKVPTTIPGHAGQFSLIFSMQLLLLLTWRDFPVSFIHVFCSLIDRQVCPQALLKKKCPKSSIVVQVVTTATLELPFFSWSFSKTLFPKHPKTLFSLQDLHTVAILLESFLGLFFAELIPSYFSDLIIFCVSFFMFCCLCCYSCFNYYPPLPSLPPTAIVNPHPIVHVRGSFICVPWLIPSPFFKHITSSGNSPPILYI